jgi:hypothetical protein
MLGTVLFKKILKIIDLGHLREGKTLKTDTVLLWLRQKLLFDFPTWGRIRIRIGIKMDNRIRIRIGIKTMQIHNTEVTFGTSLYVEEITT